MLIINLIMVFYENILASKLVELMRLSLIFTLCAAIALSLAALIFLLTKGHMKDFDDYLNY